MIIKPISGSAEEPDPGLSGNRDAGCWFLQQVGVAFRDLADSATADKTGCNENDTCRMVMCLNGDLRVCMTGMDQEDDFFLSAGTCSLQYHPGRCRCLNCAHRDRAQVLELVCPASEFVQLVGGTPVGRKLAAAMDAGRPLHVHQPMTPAIHQALICLREAVAGTDGSAAPLVFAKTLEVVWLLTRPPLPEARAPISGDTRRAVEKARAILRDNMANPPALKILAVQVGMSLSKLKQVYPLVYGMPPYAYLRQVRMERALHLIRSTDMSVIEVAFEVGYASPSRFSRAFADQFGFNPSRARRMG